MKRTLSQIFMPSDLKCSTADTISGKVFEKIISERFALQWKMYKNIHYIHEDHLKQWIHPLTHEDFRNKLVLDAGCGMGRNSYFFSKWGSSHVTAIDLDNEIVQAAKNNLKNYNCTIERQSIYEMSYKNQFDIVTCIGVVHHLENPITAIKKLIESAKPGGKILIWVYSKEGNEMLLSFLLPLRAAILRFGLGAKVVATFAMIPSLLLKLYLQFGNPTHPYYKLIRNYPYNLIHMNIVHDQLVPYISRYYTKDELEKLIKSCWNGKVGINYCNKISYSVLIQK